MFNKLTLQSRLEEWDQYRHWRLLSADIYLLVYDAESQASFNFIKVNTISPYAMKYQLEKLEAAKAA